MKNLIITILSSFISLSINAQNPDLDFENWDTINGVNQPIGWNIFYHSNEAPYFSQDTIAYSGNYSFRSISPPSNEASSQCSFTALESKIHFKKDTISSGILSFSLKALPLNYEDDTWLLISIDRKYYWFTTETYNKFTKIDLPFSSSNKEYLNLEIVLSSNSGPTDGCTGNSEVWIDNISIKTDIKKVKVFNYYDENENCVFDIGEYGVENIKTKLVGQDEIILRSDSLGFSELNIYVDSTNLVYNLELNNNILSDCYTLDEIDFSNNDSIFIDIPIIELNNCASIAGSLTLINPTPCEESTLWLNIKNESIIAVDSSIAKIFLPDGYDFLNVGSYNHQIINDTLLLYIPMINALEHLSIPISLQIDCDFQVELDHEFEFLLSANNSCETHASKYNAIQVQYDEGEISNKIGIINDEPNTSLVFSANDKLEYLLYFKNSGNDTIFEIEISDIIRPPLISKSFELIATSHPINWELKNNLLQINFHDIKLSPHSININDEYAFVRFRLNLDTILYSGQRIFNSASVSINNKSPKTTNEVQIYYKCREKKSNLFNKICPGDSLFNYFNSGVYVDTFPLASGCDSIRQLILTVLDDHSEECISNTKNHNEDPSNWVFPNPSNGKIMFNNFVYDQFFHFELYDLSGKLIQKNNLSKQTAIDVSAACNGIHLIKLTDNKNQILFTKIAIIK